MLTVAAPTDAVVTLARAMTTITHELDRLHRKGYFLRERSAGLRGIWHNDLCNSRGRLVQSWQTAPKQPHKVIEQLAAALVGLDVPVAQERPPDRGESLEILMRQRSAEVVREHEIDVFLAEQPLSSADDLLDHLDSKGLLDP